MSPAVAAPPPTPADPVIETLHGLEITDPYRWLEDQNSPRTRQWLEEQTNYTRAYLDAIPGRERIRERVAELFDLKEVISEPWSAGKRYFFLKRQRDREQPVIVMRNGLFGDEVVLVDPALRASGSSTAVAITAISHDGRFLAYAVRQGGTDHSTIEIFDIEHNRALPDRLPEGFCAGIAFDSSGSGFYYSHRKLHDPRPNYHSVFWRAFGTEPSEDQEVFFAGEEPNLVLAIVPAQQTNLVAYVVFLTGKHPRTSVYLHDMAAGASPQLLLGDVQGYFWPFFVCRQLFALTNWRAPNFRIVSIDMTDPNPTQWHDVVPESDRRIQEYAVVGDKIYVTRVDCFSTKIEAFGLDGRQTDGIPIPPHGTVSLLNRRDTITDTLLYSFTTIAKPSTVYCHNAYDRQSHVWEEANNSFDASTVAIEQVTYTSKDGTSVPLFLAVSKEHMHSGPLPTFLTGYGGFGSCVTPRFSAFANFLIEQGFLLAVPALRGGSELGEEWHQAGMCEKRQNTFDDFISAAEWLLSQRRSVPGHIAIGGGSNAGLLVGAAITQRPDLFRASICLGPLLDMIRYHRFDFAAVFADEYGSPDDEQDLRYLLAYSPYHRVKSGVEYPAVLLISGDADTRCNPMHARKMAARLQAASSSRHPILLDYRPAWGHTPVQAFSTKVEALTDRLAFICHELGVHVRPRRSPLCCC